MVQHKVHFFGSDGKSRDANDSLADAGGPTKVVIDELREQLQIYARGTAAFQILPHVNACSQLKQAAAQCPSIVFPAGGRHACTSPTIITGSPQPTGSTGILYAYSYR